MKPVLIIKISVLHTLFLSTSYFFAYIPHFVRINSRPRRNYTTPQNSFIFSFCFFDARTDNAHQGLIARVVARHKNNLYVHIRLVLRVFSRSSCRMPLASASHTLWILMARFVFTTRRWIFHRYTAWRGRGERKGCSRRVGRLQLENDQWQPVTGIVPHLLSDCNHWTLTKDRW